MGDYHRFLTMLSKEFQRYLMENEKLGDSIPPNAMVVFQVDGDDDFNAWHKDTSLKNREKDQPVICISVKKWREHSSIKELQLAEMGENLDSEMGVPGPA